jgi:NADH-quinone oxidoreductase subunit N
MLVLYLGLETMSLAAYVMTGFLVDRRKSREAAIKYFLMGAFGSALLLYGVAFLYGATGAIGFREIAAHIATPEEPVYATMGIALLLCGFAFKVAAVPFHMWAPDVYHGAPTPVTGLMAVGVKAAAFAALLRVVSVALVRAEGSSLTWMLFGLAVLTMAWGNVAAIAQKNIKRMLAYSSVAHAGYLLIAVTAVSAGSDLSTPAILVYLAAYALMTLGAFAVVMLLERSGERNLSMDAYVGLGRRHPYLAVAMAIFLLSMAGIPPTVGFVGKWYVFSSAVQAAECVPGGGCQSPAFINLAIVGVLTSLIAVYYYMRVVYLMFMKEETEETATCESPNYAARAVAFGFAIVVLLVGCYPTGIVSLARSAGMM